jgi:uncharacterized DUF497 family protein
MDFEWDDVKSESCFTSRGFDFAFTARIFFDPDRIVVTEKKGSGLSIAYQ